MSIEIQFTYTARYFKSAPITSETKAIWFVLHGYGQLAEFFLKKFKILEAHNICVIAPEGLSKFYLHNPQPDASRVNDRVGAAWMTKENRLTDIKNYITYLNTIYNAEISKLQTPLPTTVLGFSQGCATACRWLIEGSLPFDRLILWAGIFPHDMDISKAKEKFLNKRLNIVYGRKDQYLNDSRFKEMQNFIRQLDLPVETLTFEGGHEIDQETLSKLINDSV